MLGFQVAGLVFSAIILTAIVGYLIEKSPESQSHSGDHSGPGESHRS